MSNPPYGYRVGGNGGGERDVRNLYDRFGALLSQRAAGCTSRRSPPHDTPVARMHLPLRPTPPPPMAASWRRCNVGRFPWAVARLVDPVAAPR